MAQRLVAATAASAVPSTNGLRFAAPPRSRSLEEGRLSVGMELAHVAQRLGHAHVSKRGMFGFASQQVRGGVLAWLYCVYIGFCVQLS